MCVGGAQLPLPPVHATADESLPNPPLTTFPSGPPGSDKARPPDQGVKIRLPRRDQVSRAADSLNSFMREAYPRRHLAGARNGLLGSQRQRFLVLEIRTFAGPSRHVQWVLRGGPYTVASQVRQVQVVCPPPCPRPLDTGTSRPTSWLAWRIENPFLSEEESGFSAITEAPLGSA